MDRASTSKFEKFSMWSFGTFALLGILSFAEVNVPRVSMAAVAQADITSIITGVETYEGSTYKDVAPTHITAPQSVSFRIAGDFMFARGVHKKFNLNPKMSLDNIGSGFFGNADASIVNLEGAIGLSPLQRVVQEGASPLSSRVVL